MFMATSVIVGKMTLFSDHFFTTSGLYEQCQGRDAWMWMAALLSTPKASYIYIYIYIYICVCVCVLG